MKPKRQRWTDYEVSILKKYYPENETFLVADMISRKVGHIYCKARNLGIKKTPAFTAHQTHIRQRRLVADGVHNGWEKGRQPFNKGKKIEEFMSPQGIANSKKTRFLKGRFPHNHRPVGSIRTLKDGYLQRKTAEPTTWKLLHRLEWEKHHGPIPKNHAIVFRDGNKQNCKIENLELITRAELMSRNTIQRYPKELKSLIRLNSKVKKTIKNAKK